MAKGQLMVSVAGIRGVVGDTLTPELVLDYVLAYAGERAGETVVLGGDTRLSRCCSTLFPKASVSTR